MIPYGRQDLNRDDKNAVLRVLNASFITQGPEIPEFERELTKKMGARYASATSNGTAALHLAYLAAGLGPGDEVITTPNTFVATTNMLLAVGTRPVFVDIRLDTYNIDETKIADGITPNTRAIVVVDFAGHPCELATIRRLATKHRLTLISDSAHSLGARYRGRPVGSLADLTVFSFHAVKSITTGEGGAITTDNRRYYEKLKLLRSHGLHKDKNGFNAMTELGYNYRLTDIQAALGKSQLARLDQFIKYRHRVAAWYNKELADVSGIILPQELPDCYSSWHLYVIRVRNPQHRLPLMHWLQKKDIGVNFHYPAVYHHPYYRRHGYKTTHLPNTELYHRTAITLPLHTKLAREQVLYIAGAVKNFFVSR